VIALTTAHIVHDADTDEIVLGGVVDDDAVVGIAARCYRRVHITGDQLVPFEKIMNDVVKIVISISVQVTKDDQISV